MTIEEVKKYLQEDMKNIHDLEALNDLKIKYIGKKGLVTVLNQNIKDIPNEEKKEYGQKVNDLRNTFTDFYTERKNFFLQEALNQKLANESIDINLPATGKIS